MSNSKAGELGYLLKLAQISLKNAMEERLRPLGLTLPQYAILVQLHDHGNQTNAALAKRAFITAQSMQGVLSNLEISDMIQRVPDPNHGRRQPATLTNKGKRMLIRARKLTQKVEKNLSDAVAPLSEVEALALFDRIHVSLSNTT